MPRRLSLVLATLLVVVAVAMVFARYPTTGGETDGRFASPVTSVDSQAQLDSAARARAREAADTMCLASRIGLPCDPR
jgi:hypothetical protein